MIELSFFSVSVPNPLLVTIDLYLTCNIFNTCILNHIHLVTGFGDVAYNSRRGILGAVAAEREIGLHLWNIGYCGQKSNFEVKLLKQMKWHPEYNDEVGTSINALILVIIVGFILENCITSFDFNPSGETLATIDDRGVCLISDLNTDKYIFHLNMDDDNSGN